MTGNTQRLVDVFTAHREWRTKLEIICGAPGVGKSHHSEQTMKGRVLTIDGKYFSFPESDVLVIHEFTTDMFSMAAWLNLTDDNNEYVAPTKGGFRQWSPHLTDLHNQYSRKRHQRLDQRLSHAQVA
jgi:hypothetical protein